MGLGSLFRWSRRGFTLHSGGKSNLLIDCDKLNSGDIYAFAQMIASRVKFKDVVSVPRGGDRLARELALYPRDRESGVTLIVDDVLTTGASMEEVKANIGGKVVGIVIFARGRCPDWVTPVFQFDPFWMGMSIDGGG